MSSLGFSGGVCRVFVDSENVGNLIPSTLPDNTEVWFFLSDINVYRKVYGLLDSDESVYRKEART